MAAARDVVRVSGADARRYLHSQVSQDVQSLDSGESRWTFVLAPNGKVDALARIRCIDDERFELDTDPGFGDALAARLLRFKIRVAVDVAQATAVVGDDLVGWWGTTAPVSEDPADRVAAGWPAMGSEIVPGDTIPAETGITSVAVNFTKGCYPGQELVERMDSRGAAAPRSLRILDVGAGAAAGDDIVDPASGDVVGTLTTVAGGRALGYVRRGSAVGEPVGPPSSS